MQLFKPANNCPKCGEAIKHSIFGTRYSKKTGDMIREMDDWRCPNLRSYGGDLNGHYWKQKNRTGRKALSQLPEDAK